MLSNNVYKKLKNSENILKIIPYIENDSIHIQWKRQVGRYLPIYGYLFLNYNKV